MTAESNRQPDQRELRSEITIDELKQKVASIETKLSKMDSIGIPIEILPDGQEPYHANHFDAGYDLFATETIYLPPGKSYIMPVGIKVAVPEGYEIQIRPRSGISSKVSLRVANAPGTVDAGYRDEIGVILYNDYGPATTKIHQSNEGPVDITGHHYKFTSLDTVHQGDLPQDTIVIQRGDRIAQMVIAKVVRANFIKVDDVRTIGENRGGGFGSTGVFSSPANNWHEDNNPGFSISSNNNPIGFFSQIFRTTNS